MNITRIIVIVSVMLVSTTAFTSPTFGSTRISISKAAFVIEQQPSSSTIVSSSTLVVVVDDNPMNDISDNMSMDKSLLSPKQKNPRQVIATAGAVACIGAVAIGGARQLCEVLSYLPPFYVKIMVDSDRKSFSRDIVISYYVFVKCQLMQ